MSTDGQTDRKTDRQMDQQTDTRSDREMDRPGETNIPPTTMNYVVWGFNIHERHVKAYNLGPLLLTQIIWAWINHYFQMK